MVTAYPGNRYFTQSDKVRDISIKGVLKKMCENNFILPQLQLFTNKMSPNYDGLSMNDRRFSYLMEKKGVKVNEYNKCLFH